VNEYPEDVAAAEGILRHAMATMPEGLTFEQMEDHIAIQMQMHGYEGIRVQVQPYDEGVHVSMSRGELKPPDDRKPGMMSMGELMAVVFAGVVFVGMSAGLIALAWRLAT
jgi:hypothetical protein